MKVNNPANDERRPVRDARHQQVDGPAGAADTLRRLATRVAQNLALGARARRLMSQLFVDGWVFETKGRAGAGDPIVVKCWCHRRYARPRQTVTARLSRRRPTPSLTYSSRERARSALAHMSQLGDRCETLRSDPAEDQDSPDREQPHHALEYDGSRVMVHLAQEHGRLERPNTHRR